jgi:hypothetical protein
MRPAYGAREFTDDLERLLDELRHAIRSLVPDSFVEPVKVLSRDSADDDMVVVKGVEINDAHSCVDAAFASIAWSLQRAMRELRVAIDAAGGKR